MLDEKEKDFKGDEITALDTHSEKSLYYRKVPDFIRAYLVLLEGGKEKSRFEITESPVFIGRDKGMDIAIDDSSVSREHAVIFYYEGRFYIRDLKSTNGTHINGKRIEQSALNYKDLIQLGKSTLRFFIEQSERRDTEESGETREQ